MRTLITSLALGLVLAASAAHAQVSGPPGAAPPSAPPAPGSAPAPTTVDPGTLDDANSGRVALMSTALTPPAGTFSFEDEELFLVSIAYAPTDQLVVTGTTMIPVDSSLYWGYVSAKLQVLKAGRLRVAAQAGTGGAVVSDSNSSDSGGLFDIGAAATLCLDDGCYSHIDGAAFAAFAYQSQSEVPVGLAGGIVGRVGRHIRLVAEADTGYAFGRESGLADGFIGWYGVRFTSKNIGVDLELVRPFCSSSDCDMKEFPLGIPFVTFTYRSID